ALIAVPVWVLLWHAEAILLAFGQDRALAHDAQRLLHGLQWGMLLALLYLVLRSFVAALERPIWPFAVGAVGGALDTVGNYSLIFGRFGLPALGILGAGIGSTFANTAMFLAMAVVVSRHPRFRRYHLFGQFWLSDWSRLGQIWRLGLPIAITITLEVAIFN